MLEAKKGERRHDRKMKNYKILRERRSKLEMKLGNDQRYEIKWVEAILI